MNWKHWLGSVIDPPRVLRTPTHLAIYECACCKEVFFRNPAEQSISAGDKYYRLLGVEAWSRVIHGCNPNQQGLGRLTGIKVYE